MTDIVTIVAPEPADTASPCTLVCTMDGKTGWCYGCGRTIDEIAGWSMLSFDARRAVRAALPARMAVFAS